MVRRDVAGRKVARAVRRLDDAESILSRDPESLSRDAASRDLAAFYLFLAIQECIDLAAHWVADDGLAPPEDASSAFDVLAERGFIEPKTADALRAAAGLRKPHCSRIQRCRSRESPCGSEGRSEILAGVPPRRVQGGGAVRRFRLDYVPDRVPRREPRVSKGEQ